MLPANVNAMLTRRVDVDVRVRLDEMGNVVEAEPLISPGLLNAYLGKAAAAAAQLWKFQPAERGGQLVSDIVVLKFTFSPSR